MGVRENKVEKYLKDEVKRIGGTSRKWKSPGLDGVPDQIVRLHRWIKGMVHVVEVKTTDGVTSPAQKREQKREHDDGMLVYQVFGHAGVDAYIKMIDV